MKINQNFLSENVSFFCVVKFSIYLNRRVLVMPHFRTKYLPCIPNFVRKVEVFLGNAPLFQDAACPHE